MDETEAIRREMQHDINTGQSPIEGQTWTTEELTRDFDVTGFMAPFVVVTRKSDGKVGSLKFKHYPRVYFDWKEDA